MKAGMPVRPPLKVSLRSSGLAANCPEATPRLLVAGLVLVLLSGIFTMCSRVVPGFVWNYPITVYPVLVNTLGRFNGLLPFSFSEAGLYLTVVFCIISIVLLFKRPLCSLARVFFYACLLLSLFTIDCRVDHYRSSFSYEAGMVMEQPSAEELYNLCLFLTSQANSSLEEVDHSAGFLFGLYPGQTKDTPLSVMLAPREMGLESVTTMNNLGASHARLDGYYPHSKPLVNSRLLSIQQLCSVYSPLTVETNYNREMPYYNTPHTICHELSHLKGFVREDEADFIDYLACIGLQSSDFRYGDYLIGWVYTGDALTGVDPEAYYELYGVLSPKAAQDLKWSNRFWDQYDGKVVEASTQLNDHYLKAHSQEDGIRSYGRMVDLMLVYYREMPEGEKMDPDLHGQDFHEPN